MILALVDTNVVVSGVLAGVGESPNRRILDAMVAGTLRFVLSEALLVEYRQVLLRPAIAQRHRLTAVEVDVLLEALVVNASIREPLLVHEGDPQIAGDEHLVALLRAVPEAVLITGDHQLAQAVGPRYTVATPAMFASTIG